MINLDTQGDREAYHDDQEKFVDDGVRQLEADQTAEEKKEETLVAQQQFTFFSFYFVHKQLLIT